MRNGIRAFILAGSGVAMALALSAARTGQEASRTQELLKQARTALGGEAQFAAVKSLSVSIWSKNITPMREIESDGSIEIQLPDKFRKSDSAAFGPGMEFTTTQIVNGAEVSTQVDSGGGGGGQFFTRMGGGQASPEMKAMAERAVRVEYARTMILLLLASPENFPVEFTYSGEEDLSGKMADVLDVKGPENFAARLYLDQKSHQPVMLTYKERPRNMQFRMGGGGQGGGGESREEMQRKAQDAAKSGTPPEEVEVQLRIVDYKATGGVSFPHKLSKTTAGKVTEEREYSKFKINPTLKTDRFKKKEEPQQP